MFERRGGFSRKMELGNCVVEVIEIERGSKRGEEEIVERVVLRVNGIQQVSMTRDEAIVFSLALANCLESIRRALGESESVE